MNKRKHISVLTKELLKLIDPYKKNIYLDCTFGNGGHSKAIIEKTNSKIIAIDFDPKIKNKMELIKKNNRSKIKFYNMNFSLINKIIDGKFDGAFFDLGTSFLQISNELKGISFNSKTINMKINSNILECSSTLNFLNYASTKQLIRAIRDYGEEKNWKKIIKSIRLSRGTSYLYSCKNFSNLINNSLRLSMNYNKKNLATKTFQGIRILINNELWSINSVLPNVFNKLKIGGILIIISFNSLEDRIIKNFIRETRNNAIVLSEKTIVSNIEETYLSYKCRSAKLRSIKKKI